MERKRDTGAAGARDSADDLPRYVNEQLPTSSAGSPVGEETTRERAFLILDSALTASLASRNAPSSLPPTARR